MDINNENLEIIDGIEDENKKSSEIFLEIEENDKTQKSTMDNEVKIEEKLETKGLKLKKTTKNRLNELQGKFDDAETMVLALLNQYEMFKLNDNNQYANRKAEIDKFSYLLDSIKNSYIASLDMATFVEKKFEDTFKEELNRREKTIARLQENIEKKEDKIKGKEEELKKKDEELKTVKDSFSRVNLALTTLEKEIKEKSEVIKNTQIHISSLTELAEEGKSYKKRLEEVVEENRSLSSKAQEYQLLEMRLENAEQELSKSNGEVRQLKEEVKEGRNYSNMLNDKILNILTSKSEEINNINEINNRKIEEIENSYKDQILKKDEAIEKLQTELLELKLSFKGVK